MQHWERVCRMANLNVLAVKQGSDSTSVLMLLHGIGGNEQSIAALSNGVDPRLNVISVQAPLRMGPAAYAWYPTHFGPNGPVIDGDEANLGRRRLLEFLKGYRAEHKVRRLYLMGFSQGSIMSVAAALSEPSLVQGVVGFSGRFPKEFEPTVSAPESLTETPIWLAHGTEDGTLPIELGRAMAGTLKQFRARYSFTEFAGTHQVTPQMLAAGHRWLSALIEQEQNKDVPVKALEAETLLS